MDFLVDGVKPTARKSAKNAKAIVNPAAGGHSIYREWPSLSKHLLAQGLSFDYAYTEGAGHATELAREAANSGYDFIIAVGGDGTVNEIVNGVLSSTSPYDKTIGIVSAGTTCSFARSLGIPLDPVNSGKLLTSQNTISIDVGLVEYRRGNEQLRRFFVNEADVGFGATVVEASKLMHNYFGRKINYLPHILGGIGSLFSYKNKRIAISVDAETEEICVCTMLVIANGTYFGGGMRVAPYAKPDDGLLDMILFGDMGKSEMMKIWSMTYNGRHITNEKVRLRQIRNLSIQSNEKVLVEADGELIGEGPTSFSVLPSALRIAM
jgi:YegS/Rv2252/BmrU family lipid kinase